MASLQPHPGLNPTSILLDHYLSPTSYQSLISIFNVLGLILILVLGFTDHYLCSASSRRLLRLSGLSFFVAIGLLGLKGLSLISTSIHLTLVTMAVPQPHPNLSYYFPQQPRPFLGLISNLRESYEVLLHVSKRQRGKRLNVYEFLYYLHALNRD
jgi:hypothetical protein